MHLAELCVRYRPLAFAHKLAADDSTAVVEFLKGCLQREKVLRLASKNLRRWSHLTLKRTGYT
jgi:hypothetical protein